MCLTQCPTLPFLLSLRAHLYLTRSFSIAPFCFRVFLFLLFVPSLRKPTFVVVIPTVHYQSRCRNACLEHTLRPRAPPSCRIDLSPLDDTSSNNEPPKGLRHFGIIDANHPAASPVLDSSGCIFLFRWGLREFSRGSQPAARKPLFSSDTRMGSLYLRRINDTSACLRA